MGGARGRGDFGAWTPAVVRSRRWAEARWALTFTTYVFTSRLLCTNQFSSIAPPQPALLTPLHCYFTSVAQYTTRLRHPCVCHTTYPIWSWQYRAKTKLG